MDFNTLTFNIQLNINTLQFQLYECEKYWHVKLTAQLFELTMCCLQVFFLLYILIGAL